MLAGLSLLAGAAAAAELSAEERLQAVRHGLAQQSLQGATQVQTTAWIDEQGSLRESSSFRTGMQVRGVRVIAYSRDGQGQPQAQLQVQSPQDLLKPQAADAKPAGVKPATAAASCRVQEGLHHVVGLQMQPRGRWPIDEEHLRRDAAQVLAAAWRDASGGSRWHLLELQAAPAPQASSSRGIYERLLTAGPATSPALAWRLQLDMEQVPSSAPIIHLPWSGVSGRVRLSLSLLSPRDSRPVWQRVEELPLRAQERALSAPRLHPSSGEQLQALVRGWAQAVSEHLACEPVQVQVINSQADVLQIDQGRLAGVRAGDEWLVSDRRRWPGRMLESEAAQALVLARVEQVSDTRAQLQVLAGPASAVRPNWQAWPMDKAH
jgi:hypothetical protein